MSNSSNSKHEIQRSKLMIKSAFSRISGGLLVPIARLPSLDRNAARANWVDVAKGVSISLVVIWHVVGDFSRLNEALIFLRMPLFFFVAGLFARTNFLYGQEMRTYEKLANFLWIFSIWSVILFFLTRVPILIVQDRDVLYATARLPLIFLNPPQTIWFIYALAISFAAVFALRSLPVSVVLLISVVIFSISASDGNWRGVFFWERIFRLLPFFIMGLIAFPVLNFLCGKLRWAGPIMLFIFCVASYHVYFTDLVHMGYLVFLLSIVGILAIALVSDLIAETRAGYVLASIGVASLFVYLIHRIFIFSFNTAVRIIKIDLEANIFLYSLSSLLFVAGSIMGSIALGRYLASTGVGRHLFKNPFWKAS